ncbi:MAG TPA: hypothetical protein VFO55_13545 [Gemmatimonadaceae bacterium]|nr:hypothetical protein [Gemmatimonadaceae bacterium]
MAGQFRPADHSKGDANTIGGYMAVHDRPAAFEGSDGFSYSVEILSQHEPGEAPPWAAFFLFIRWARIGAQSPEGHLESDYVARGATEDDALSRAGQLTLAETKIVLDGLITRAAGRQPTRRWFDAMRDES